MANAAAPQDKPTTEVTEENDTQNQVEAEK